MGSSGKEKMMISSFLQHQKVNKPETFCVSFVCFSLPLCDRRVVTALQDTHTSEPVAKTKGDLVPILGSGSSWNAQTNMSTIEVRNWKTIGKIYTKKCPFFKSQQTKLKPQMLEVFWGFLLGRLTLGSWILWGLGWFGGAVVLSLGLLGLGEFSDTIQKIVFSNKVCCFYEFPDVLLWKAAPGSVTGTF